MLQLDGQTIGDSTAIIAALERIHPEPSLYPGDPAERLWVLELEEFFDEELGPAIRSGTMPAPTGRAWRTSRRKLLPGPLREFGPP